MTKIYPVIMCGGAGTRLWPLSRELHPKQLTNVRETGQVDLYNHQEFLMKETLAFRNWSKRQAALFTRCKVWRMSLI